MEAKSISIRYQLRPLFLHVMGVLLFPDKGAASAELKNSDTYTRHCEAMAAEFHFKRLARAEKDALLARAAEQPLEDVLAKCFDLRAHDDPSQTDSVGDPNTVS